MTRDEKKSIEHALFHLEDNKICDDRAPTGFYFGDKAKFIRRHKKAIALMKKLLKEPTR